MAQQGQVFRLKGNGGNCDAAWAYRYRLDGRGSKRPQVGGFAPRLEAQVALRRQLAHLRPGGRAATLTLAELVGEYLETHEAAPTTIAKLRWLLAKATRALGATCAWSTCGRSKCAPGGQACPRAAASRPRRRSARF